MSTHSDSGVITRKRTMTLKGKQYKLDMHFAESVRIVKRLDNQKILINDLMQSTNVEILNRELAKLDAIHENLLETYAQVREIIQVQGEEDESKEPARLAELVKVVDKQDSEVFETKKLASEWLITQMQAEEKSVVSGRSGRSRKTTSQRSKRPKSGDSRRSGSADSRASGRSARSNCSRLSDVSRTSKKAKIAGLKAEVEVLKSEGKVEIEEQVKLMKLKAEVFENEQNAVLQAEIERKENAILQHDQQLSDTENEKTRNIVADEAPNDQVANVLAQMRVTTERLKEERGKEKEIQEKQENDEAQRLKETQLKEERLKEERLKKELYEIERQREKRLRANILSKEHERSKTDGSDQSITHAMMEMIKVQAAPKVNIDVFRGDPLEYIYFISNFKDMVESVVEDQRGRLNRLIQYTSGEAKDLIRHCVHNDPTQCYDDALILLGREYGDPLRIACAYMDKLKNWPNIKFGDGAGFKGLYRFLLQCRAFQKSGYLDGLDSPLMIRNIQLKLPVQGQDRWAQLVGKIRKREKKGSCI